MSQHHEEAQFPLVPPRQQRGTQLQQQPTVTSDSAVQDHRDVNVQQSLDRQFNTAPGIGQRELVPPPAKRQRLSEESSPPVDFSSVGSFLYSTEHGPSSSPHAPTSSHFPSLDSSSSEAPTPRQSTNTPMNVNPQYLPSVSPILHNLKTPQPSAPQGILPSPDSRVPTVSPVSVGDSVTDRAEPNMPAYQSSRPYVPLQQKTSLPSGYQQSQSSPSLVQRTSTTAATVTSTTTVTPTTATVTPAAVTPAAVTPATATVTPTTATPTVTPTTDTATAEVTTTAAATTVTTATTLQQQQQLQQQMQQQQQLQQLFLLQQRQQLQQQQDQQIQRSFRSPSQQNTEGSSPTPPLQPSRAEASTTESSGLRIDTRFPFLVSEVKRTIEEGRAVLTVPGAHQQNSLGQDSVLSLLLHHDASLIEKLRMASRDSESAVKRGTLLHRLHREIDQLESALMLEEKQEDTPTSMEAPPAPVKTFNTWFELYDDLKRQRLLRMKSPSFWKEEQKQLKDQTDVPVAADMAENGLGHERLEAALGKTDDSKSKRPSRRRWARLAEFQNYIRTQVTVHHSIASASASSFGPDDPRSSVVSHLPPQISISSREGRKTKLLGRLRTESQMLLRDLDDRKRARLDFLKEVVRHRNRFVDFHARNVKLTKRVALNLSRQLAARERKDLSSEAQFQRERLAALRARDEVQYMKLLRETKNQRLLELVKQTEDYMNQLGTLVRQHRDEQQRNGRTEEAANDAKEEEDGPSYDALIAAKNRYFELTHSIQEEVVVPPSNLKGGQLREYQLKGLSWMVSLYNNNLNGILADAMGLGKTIQTISLLGYLHEVKGTKGPFLIVAPLSTLHSGWVAEFKKWLPSFHVVIYDGSKDLRKSLRMKYFGTSNDAGVAFNVLLTTDAFIMKDATHLKKINWEYLIVDEAHRLKNPQSKLVQVLTDKRAGRGFRVKRRLALTGTPLQNDLQEVWALLNFLMPTIFNSSETFKQWFNAPLSQAGSQHQVDITEEEQLLIVDRLHKVLRPFLLRREKKEVENEVPQKHEEVLWCPMSGLQQELYKVIESRETPNGASVASNVLMQLRKVCNHPYLFCPKGPAGPEIPSQLNADESLLRVCGKFWVLDDVLTKLKATGHRVLIFSQMVKLLNILEVFLSLRGWAFLRLDGSTSSEDRLTRLSLFNQPNSPYFIFLLSTKAGGLGVNLQTADTVIIYDSDWNPQNDEQAQSRAHRIGQTREVLILRLITADTVEERILTAAGIKLDKDALVIKSGMFYDSHHDLEDERRNRVKAVLSKKNQRQSATFYEHGVVNRILARTEEELAVFSKVDKKRRLLGLGGLILQSGFPPILNRLSRNPSQTSANEWRAAYAQDCPWVAKNRDIITAEKDSPEILSTKKSLINKNVLRAISEICSNANRDVSAASVIPFINVPNSVDHPTYADIIQQPMCLQHIKTFAERQNFSSLV
ncbi:uncharacterized protein LOC129617843 [Condylostylus longicornis]|uniref:uncharacterized protein LOC129617843 n=1 Tax=Condylostylus longicornis TaxID=2530218 RepID=UPI00244DFC15|nr:uncharacterized protein LOC129617843 [Condylostylus longicornis]